VQVVGISKIQGDDILITYKNAESKRNYARI